MKLIYSCLVHLVCTFLVIAGHFCNELTAQDKYAVVVGVESYSDFEPLNFAEDDALSLGESLEKLGFQTKVLTGKSRNSSFKPTNVSKILNAIKTQTENCANGDTLVVSLSGHGVQFQDEELLPTGVRESYFCPEDADVNDKSTLIPIHKSLIELINDCAASKKLLILDACRKEVLSKDATRKSGTRIELKSVHESRRSVPGGMSVIFSCSNNQFSWEHKALGHSVFSYFLLKYLNGDSGDQFYEKQKIDLDGLVFFVRKRTNEYVFNENLSSDGQLPTLAGSSTNWVLGNKKPSLIRKKVSEFSLNESLESFASSLCEKLSTKLEEMDVDEIAIGNFNGPAFPSTGAGNGIRRFVAAQLANHDVKLVRRSKYELQGDFRDVDADGTPKLRLALRLIDTSTGDQAASVSELNSNHLTISKILGLSLQDLGPGADDTKIAAAVKGGVREPKSFVKNSASFLSGKHKFGMELAVKDRNSPKISRMAELTTEDGLVFASLSKDDVYAIKLINNHDFDIVVELTIDGINAFAFSGFKTTKFYVPKQNSFYVKGWPTGLSTLDQFVVSSYAESASAELGQPRSNVGVITATYQAAWKKGDAPPSDEKLKTRGVADNLATGRGKEIESKFQPVKVVQGRVRGVLSIRYNR